MIEDNTVVYKQVCDSGCQTITAMTRKMNVNVHVISHIKEKLVLMDEQTQASIQKLADIDEDIAKVSGKRIAYM